MRRSRSAERRVFAIAHRGPLVVVAAVLAVVVAVLAPLLPWWVTRSGDPEAFGGLAVQAAGVAVLIATLTRASGAGRLAPASLVVGAVLLWGGIVVDVRLLQMAGALCLGHAAVAVVAPARTRQLVPVLWLLLLGLPLTGDLDVIGFPARLFAARVAEAGLSLQGVAVVGAETVLVVEGNVADVEAPCAGLGTLRMLAAVVLVVGALRLASLRAILMALFAAGAVAVVGNAVRVTALASLALAAGREDLARLVHVPLGVLAFGAAVFVADLVLQQAGRLRPGTAGLLAGVQNSHRHLAALVLVAAVASCLRLDASMSATSATTTLHREPSPDAIELSASESSLFARHALFAEKRRLPEGSVLLVVATSLRAHHAPERCLAGSGFRVDSSANVDVAGFTVKRLVLDGGARIGWSFYVRDDDGVPLVRAGLLDRLFDQLRAPRQRGVPWVFVSAVVSADADVATLIPRLVGEAHAVSQPPRLDREL